jgi:tetratricopeptide (TPR) repeat protein
MNKVLSTYRTYFICLALVSATFAVFHQLLDCKFVDYDDALYVFGNPAVKAGLTAESIKWAFTATDTVNWHPLTWLSHMLDCQLFGLNPKWHHLVNLLFHTANALLLFWVLKNMTGTPWQSAFVAAAFALHPLHVESVAWVSERKDVLSTLFWLLTMAAYVRYVRHSGIKWYAVTLLLFVLGLMAKPMLVTLPFVLLLLDYWPLGCIQNKEDIMNLALEKLPFFILSVFSSIVTFLVQRIAGAVLDIEALPLHIRAANAVVSYGKYICKMIWPSRLAVFYPYHRNEIPVWQVVTAALLLVMVSILVIRLALKHRYLPVGWFWYLGSLVPVIGLVQVGSQSLADRYTYVPFTGLFIIAAWGTPELLAGRRYKKVVIGVLAGAVLFAFSVTSFFQVGCWHNSITLFEHTLAVTRNNNTILNNLANTLASQGKYEQAIVYFEEAIQVSPNDYKAHNNLGNALSSLGRYDEAVSYYLEAIRLNPHHAKAYGNLGIALASQDKLDEATGYYRKALEIEPDSAEANYNLGMVLASKGKFDEAINYYHRGLEIEPGDAKMHYSLAKAYQSQGNADEAVSHYRQAIYFKPDWPLPMKDIAWILATHPDPKIRNAGEAIRFAERAAELTKHQDAPTLLTLAAAYAADEQFKAAVIIAQDALKLAADAGDNILADRIRKQLEIYEKQSKSKKF